MEDVPSRSRLHLKVLLFLLALPLLFTVLAQAPESARGVSLGQLLLLVGLLLLSGLMSGSETALTAIGSWKVRQLREDGHDPSGAFALLEKNPTRFITTLLIGNNLVNIAATALVTQIVLQLSRSYGFAESLAVGYATGIMTLLILVFGEITPKSIAVHNAEPFSRLVIRPVYLLSVVLYPIGLFFTWIASRVLRLFRLEPSTSPLISQAELRLMLRSAEVSSVLELQEQEMIRSVIDLEERVVREVMTPRVDMVAVDEGASLEELLRLTTENGYSRLPVYRETIDDIRGVVYARDLLPYLGRPEALSETRVSDLMIQPQYVPETLSVMNLLRDMRLRKNHLAVVVDEFGGTSGLVTLEDIIEEITGEIYDETDTEEEEDIRVLGEDDYRIQGAAHLEQVAGELDLAFRDDGEYDTLAGFLISEFGYIPSVGESFDYQGVRFTVEEADERRIISVLASRDPRRSAAVSDTDGEPA
ncbi:MAG: hemolysin family protein [Truepera sp.]|nr:hemolysin family protein [Truepera sp.]